MNRLIAVLMFAFLLPLQTSWAAIVIYCQHETGVSANHLGHHAQDRQAFDLHSFENDSNASAEVEDNCVTCHPSCTVAMVDNDSFSTATKLKHLYSSHQVNPFRISIERPERPKWYTLA